jgi:hypothetical protein
VVEPGVRLQRHTSWSTSFRDRDGNSGTCIGYLIRPGTGTGTRVVPVPDPNLHGYFFLPTGNLSSTHENKILVLWT